MGGDCISNFIYIPILIVAKDLEGNFVHTREADVDKIYYCPCCDKKVKIRADESIHMQRHFYHFEGSECTKETLYHWVYKNWLFVDDSKFAINDNTYTVSQIYVEKTFQTKFGAYRPDIYVETKEGCSFFFEINYSSKKDRELACKWIDLNCDVVEVDIRDLLLADFNQSLPVFDLIFKDGKYLKKYHEREKRDLYSSAVIEYRRNINDDINRFNRLDNIWITLVQYKTMKETLNNVVNVICDAKNEDLNFCMKLLKRLKCVDVYEKCKEYINNCFLEKLEEIKKIYFPKSKIYIEQESKQIFNIIGKFEAELLNSIVCDYFSIRFRSFDGVYYNNYLDGVVQEVKSLKKRYIKFKIIANQIKSNYSSNSIRLGHSDNLQYKFIIVEHFDHIHSKYIKESIGIDYVDFYKFTDYDFQSEHERLISKHKQIFEKQLKIESLKRNSKYRECISILNNMIDGNDKIKIYEDINNLKFIIRYGNESFEYDLSVVNDLSSFDELFFDNAKLLISNLLTVININNVLEKYKNKINLCKNKVWFCDVKYGYRYISIQISIKDSGSILCTKCKTIYESDLLFTVKRNDTNKYTFYKNISNFENYIEDIILGIMSDFKDGTNEYRLMEVCK